jgi:hypothetical protein
MNVGLIAASAYSERAVAVICSLHIAGLQPVICICRSTFSVDGFVRKVGQFGARRLFQYAVRRIGRSDDGTTRFENPYLARRMERLGVRANNLRAACRMLDVPFVSAIDVNGPRAQAACRSASVDLIVYTGGGILRHGILSTAKLGAVNAHAGSLPEYRGMNVTEWAILTDGALAVSVHLMDHRIDTGPVIRSIPFEVEPSDTVASLRARVEDLTVDGLVGAALDFANGRAQPVAQTSAGKRFFVLHERLRPLVEAKLRRRSKEKAASP